MENRGIEYGQIQGIAEKASRAAYLTIKNILLATQTLSPRTLVTWTVDHNPRTLVTQTLSPRTLVTWTAVDHCPRTLATQTLSPRTLVTWTVDHNPRTPPLILVRARL